MKSIIKLFSFMLLGLLISCQEEFDLGEAPTTEDAVFSFVEDAQGENYIKFSNSSGSFLRVWDFGNGSSAEGNDIVAYFPFEGTYDVTLTVYTKGGSQSSTQSVTIANTDPEVCNVEILQLLTGGCDSVNGKTWVIDSQRDVHFGVGPAAGTYPDWYQAKANEKAGGGMYDDEYTFILNQSVFVQKTNGDVFVNGAQVPNFPGAVAAVGDFNAPYTAPDNINYSIFTQGGNQFFSLNNGGFIGYATGVSRYQIISIDENEMFIKFLDAANPDLAWYHRLIRKGYTPPPPPPPATATLPIDFESVQIPFNGFEGAGFSQADNPDKTGINTSDKVGKIGRSTLPYSGISVALDSKVDFSVNNVVKLKVWSPVATRALLKFEENGNGGNSGQREVAIPTANEWVELEFDFAGSPAEWDVLVLFLDFEGATAADFYFDDIIQTQNVASLLHIDFEGSPPTLFSDFGNTTNTVVSNAPTGSIMQVVKTTGSNDWGGGSYLLPFTLNFSTATTIKMRVFSTRPNITVKFKIENENNGNIAVERDYETTKTGQWEEATFDFSGTASNTYSRIAVFMDFGFAGDATYYFDDIIQE